MKTTTARHDSANISVADADVFTRSRIHSQNRRLAAILNHQSLSIAFQPQFFRSTDSWYVCPPAWEYLRAVNQMYVAGTAYHAIAIAARRRHRRMGCSR